MSNPLLYTTQSIPYIGLKLSNVIHRGNLFGISYP